MSKKKKKVAHVDTVPPGMERRLWWLCILGSPLLLAASFAPLKFAWFAWIAPLGWLHVIEAQPAIQRRHVFMLWISGCVFWLLNLHSIRLAFWALIFGWLALSLYLAVYIPFFVIATRVLRNVWRWPLWLAAPTTWVGFEVVRSFMITGYAASQLGHTQVRWTTLIQIADQLGGYGVSFLVMLVSVAVYQLVIGIRERRLNSARLPVCLASLAITLTLIYGYNRLQEAKVLANQPPLLRVALIQENTPTMFDAQAEERSAQAWVRYKDTTAEAAKAYGQLDLVVWPESTFTAGVPWMDFGKLEKLPPQLTQSNMDLDFFNQRTEQMRSEFGWKVNAVLAAAKSQSMPAESAIPAATELTGPHLLVGCDALKIDSTQINSFNSAIWIAPSGQYMDRYDKMHLVMFGEYIPLGAWLQFLADAFGVGSLTPGTEVKCFEIAGTKLAPSICFETMLPELISWQQRELKKRGTDAHVLVNVTNDSWFRGTSMLDHHLDCAVFCAVENRRPLLVAANTGLTAAIDGAGNIEKVTQRLERATVLAEPKLDSRWGLVQSYGYPVAWAASVIAVIALLQPLWPGIFRAKSTALDPEN